MSVYKKTCESGKVYYGSTGNDINVRKSKGHYHCACKDFINPKMEIIEYIDDPVLRYERELYYINDYYKKNKEHIHSLLIKNRAKVIEEKRHECKLCDMCFQSNKKLQRHIDGYRHQLKYKSFLKYGDDWKQYYLKDNQKRHGETRKYKNSISPAVV